jgi:plastocyanin
LKGEAPMRRSAADRMSGHALSLRALGVALAALAVVPALAADPVTRELVIKDHRFEPAEIEVPAGQRVVLQLRNLDATPEEFDSPALKIEKVVSGHGEGTVRLHPLAPGRYEFIGEYHPDTARGAVVAK